MRVEPLLSCCQSFYRDCLVSPAVDEDAPDPPGIVDIARLTRPDAAEQRAALLQSLEDTRADFEKVGARSFLYYFAPCCARGHVQYVGAYVCAFY